MGMDLMGPAGYFGWNYPSWHKLLGIAERYGGRPAGTVPAAAGDHVPGGTWDGGYTTNDFQTVTAEDAVQLAAALERALPDIPEEDVPDPHRTALVEIAIAPDEPAADLDWFSGPGSREHIRAFIQFCRAGPFSIG
jgi:hypothetical protein